jgi:hypothetical protein
MRAQPPARPRDSGVPNISFCTSVDLKDAPFGVYRTGELNWLACRFENTIIKEISCQEQTHAKNHPISVVR